MRTLRRLDKAFSAFFKGKGFPRFKAKEHFSSIDFAKRDGAAINGGKLRVQSVGCIRVRWHRPLPSGRVKQCTIMTDSGKWYAIFLVEISDTPTTKNKAAVGIDLGIETFVTTSEGQRLGDSRILHRKLDDIRRKDKAVSRCVRGSTGREKARKSLASVHLKARNARLDMHHKVSLELVRRFGFIAAEDLDVQAMLKNKRLARQIKDAGWSSFIQILTRKCQMHGCRIALVNPRGTSQTCSQCGAVVAKLLWQRTHTCSCGLSIHRDLNAARNILARAEPGFANVGNSLLEPEAAIAV
jgi:putative transposase